MKVLFVGEGDHDIGPAGEIWGRPRPARGVVPVLAHRVCSLIQIEGLGPAGGEDTVSIALAWREIPRFSLRARRGFEGKVEAAILLSSGKYGCVGTVCVSDRDGDGDRIDAMKRGKHRGLEALVVPHAAAVGVAVEAIEAWTLGAPRALAEELAVSFDRLQAELPSKPVEKLRTSSGRDEHRPKALIARLAALAHREDGTTLRSAVAARTDVEELGRACPEGFGRFAEELRTAFEL